MNPATTKNRGEHKITRPRVCCLAFRRTLLSGGTPETAREDACAPRTARADTPQ